MHKTIGLVVFVGLLGAALPSAVAAPTGPKAKAKKLFEQGELHYQQGDFTKALRFYKQAHKTFRHPAFIFNIAQCHRQLKHYAKALFFYRLFLSERPQASNRVEVKRRITQMERKVKELAAASQQVGRVSILSQPEGAAVRVDKFTGPKAGTTPVILKLSAGEHLVLFEKKGYQKLHKTVTVKAGRIAMLTVKLQPKAASARIDPRRTEPRRTEPRRTEPRPGVTPDPGTPAPKLAYKPFWKRWWFWTGAAVTVVALGLGTFTGAMALHDHNRYLRDGVVEDQDSAVRLARTTDLLLFGGAALGIATVVGAIVVHMRYKKARRERASAAVDVTPSCGARGCGVWVQGRF